MTTKVTDACHCVSGVLNMQQVCSRRKSTTESAEFRWRCSRCVGSLEQAAGVIMGVIQGDGGTAWSSGEDAPGV